MSPTWPIRIGETLLRREVHNRVGGSWQPGITRPRGRDDVLIFSDPIKGKKYGYDLYEGLRPDGLFAYTGDGQEGDQDFTKGNKTLIESASKGLLLRVFKVQGTSVTYIGAFTLADPPFEFREIPDRDRVLRRGIIFLLAPVDADVAHLRLRDSPEQHKAVIADWIQPESGSFTVELQPRELEMSRVEFDLQASFGQWLKSRNHEIKALSLAAGNTRIRPDIYDATAGEVIEAKKSTARSYVRMAIGQSLDYANNARRAGIDAKPAILLPGRTESDLTDLCERLNVRVHRRVDDGFVTSDW